MAGVGPKETEMTSNLSRALLFSGLLLGCQVEEAERATRHDTPLQAHPAVDGLLFAGLVGGFAQSAAQLPAWLVERSTPRPEAGESDVISLFSTAETPDASAAFVIDLHAAPALPTPLKAAKRAEHRN
jgi:hypothetical protein